MSGTSGMYFLDVTDSGDIDWIAQGDPERRLTAIRATILEAAESGVVLCARDEGRIVATVHLTAQDQDVRARLIETVQESSGTKVPNLNRSQYPQMSVGDTAMILERRQKFFAALSQSAVETLTQFQATSGRAVSISGLATDPECQGRALAVGLLGFALSAIDRAGLESVLVVENRDKMHTALQQRYTAAGFAGMSDYDVTDAQDGCTLKVICMKRPAKSS